MARGSNSRDGRVARSEGLTPASPLSQESKVVAEAFKDTKYGMAIEDAVKAYKPLESIGDNLEKVLDYIMRDVANDVRSGYMKKGEIEKEYTIRIGNQVFGVQIPQLKAQEYGGEIDVFIDGGNVGQVQLGVEFPEKFVEVWPVGEIQQDGSVTSLEGKNVGNWREFVSKQSKIADGVSFGKPYKPRVR